MLKCWKANNNLLIVSFDKSGSKRSLDSHRKSVFKEIDMGDSYTDSSEEIDEMYCELCKKKGISRTAEGFCVDCVEYFCSSCLKFHCYFLPTHVQKDKTSMPQDVCVKPCLFHSDEIIKFYCSACEQFFCTICKQTNHSQCTTVSHLPVLVQILDITNTFNEVNTKLDNTLKAVEKRKSNVNEQSQIACEYAKNAKSALYLKKTLVLEWLDRNVENIEKVIEEIQTGDEKTLQSEGSALSAIKDEANTIKARLNNKTLLNKRCELFMTIKETEKQEEQIDEMLGQVEEHFVTCYEFKSSDDCEILLADGSLGNLTKKLRKAQIEAHESSTTFMSNASKLLWDSTISPEKEELNEEVSTATKDIAKQKSTVEKCLQRPFIQGEVWYIIDIKWLRRWKWYVGYDSAYICHAGDESAHPGPIDNTPILQEGSQELKEHLRENRNYKLLPENCWIHLRAWYGLAQGQDPLPRKVIMGHFKKSLEVEVYPLLLRISEYSNPDKLLPLVCSRDDKIDYFEKMIRNMFDISAECPVRFWNRYMTDMRELLDKKDATLQEAGVYHKEEILIEQQNRDGTWPSD